MNDGVADVTDENDERNVADALVWHECAFEGISEEDIDMTNLRDKVNRHSVSSQNDY